MSTFSENQVTHLYIPNARSTTALNSASALGTIRVGYNNDEFWFEFMGKGGIVRSDRIPKGSAQVKVSKYTSMQRKLNKKKFVVSSDAEDTSNSSNVRSGMDCICNIRLRNYMGGGEDIVMFKHGAVHTSSMSKGEFYEKMSESINKCLARDGKTRIKAYVDGVKSTVVVISDKATITAKYAGPSYNGLKIKVSITATTEGVTEASGTYTIGLTASAKTLGDLKRVFEANFPDYTMTVSDATETISAAVSSAVTTASGTGTGVIVEEIAQPWTLGLRSQDIIDFDIYGNSVNIGNNVEIYWMGEVTDLTSDNSNYVGNGKKIADMEHFFMGERGDQYRMMGYPNYVPTEYMADASKEYNTINIHYFFQGEGISIQKSEKDICIAVPCGAAGHVYDVINNIIDDIETASGLTIAGLS